MGKNSKVCFCKYFLQSNELIAYPNLSDCKEIFWRKYSLHNNAPKFVRICDIRNCFLVVSQHVKRVEKYPIVNVYNRFSQEAMVNQKNLTHLVSLLSPNYYSPVCWAVCSNARTDNSVKVHIVSFSFQGLLSPTKAKTFKSRVILDSTVY